MDTNIYATYEDFFFRENEQDNGVSEEFAQKHDGYHGTDYIKMNDSNQGCWNCAKSTGCSNCVELVNCHGQHNMDFDENVGSRWVLV